LLNIKKSLLNRGSGFNTFELVKTTTAKSILTMISRNIF